MVERASVMEEKESDSLRAANTVAKSMLAEAGTRLRTVLDDEAIAQRTPIEVMTAMEITLESIDAAITKLKAAMSAGKRSVGPPGGPTRQQGQFLAFIREYMMRNHAGIAPTHANLQRFFNLTAPSVNSMLVRLERRGFIRRIPRQTRAIELIINPDWIPPLDRPFKLH